MGNPYSWVSSLPWIRKKWERDSAPIGLQLWDRAKGKTTRLLKLVPPPESFEESIRIRKRNRNESSRSFLSCADFSSNYRSGSTRFTWSPVSFDCEITFSDKSAYQHQFKIPEPTNNGEVLFRMLHTHLENFKSDFPIIAVALKAEPTKPSYQQFNLFETALRDPARLSETLARLTGLLGADRVGTPGSGRDASAGCVSNRTICLAVDQKR